MPTQTREKTNSTAPVKSYRKISADKDGKLPSRIQILRAGKFATAKYGEMDVRIEDLREMAANFKAGIGLAGGGEHGAPINFGHNFGGEAAGWMMGLEVDESEQALYATDIEWSDVGEAAIKNKRYKFFSSEFWLRGLAQKWFDSENTNFTATNVLDGGALTNIPLFRNQKAVTASVEGGEGEESMLFINASGLKQKENKMPTLDQVLAKNKSELTDDDRQVIADNVDKLSHEQKINFGLAKEEKQNNPEPVAASAVKGDEGNVFVSASEVVELRQKAEASNELSSRVEAAEKTIKTLQENVNASKESEAERFVKSHAARGAIKASEVESWTKLVVASEENKNLLKNLPDNPDLAKEQGTSAKAGDATDPKTRVEAAIKSAMEEDKNLTEATATEKVARENPQLYQEYEAALQGGN